MGPPEDEGDAGVPAPDAAASTARPDPATEPVTPDPSDPGPVEHPIDNETRPQQLALPLPGLDADADEGDLRWVADAEAGLDVLRLSGRPFTAHELRALVGVPQVRNRVGAAFLRARLRGDIQPVGVANSASRSRHSGKVFIWRGAA